MIRKQIHNRKELKERRIKLRNHSTTAEVILWTLLKGKQLEGRKFRRQQSIGRFIVDFYCPAEKLAIELDGAGHFEERQMIYDTSRTAFLHTLGIRVLRFENDEVFQSPEAVMEEIRRHLGGRE